MDFKVLIADSAIADLKQIVEFVAEDNPEAAIRLGEKLLGHALIFLSPLFLRLQKTLML